MAIKIISGGSGRPGTGVRSEGSSTRTPGNTGSGSSGGGSGSSSSSPERALSGDKPRTRESVISAAKEMGILDSEGRIKPGKTSQWRELYSDYKSGKDVEALASKGMGVPVTQAPGSDEATTRESIRESARLTAQAISKERVLRGAPAEVSVTVSSQALREVPKAERPDIIRQGLLQSPRSQSIDPEAQARIQQAQAKPKVETFGDIAPFAMAKVGQAVQWFGKRTDTAPKDVEFESFVIQGPKWVTPVGGGQIVGATARAGQVGARANFVETAARTIYSAAGAGLRYKLVSEGTTETAGIINPQFKEVYDDPQFKDAIKSAREAQSQATYSETVNVGGVGVPYVKGLVGELPFVNFNRDVFQETLVEELKGSGLEREQILKAAGLQRFASDVGFTTAALFIESQSEAFGRTGVSRRARELGPEIAVGRTGAQATVAKIVRRPIQRAGITEGFSASVLYDVSRDQDINLARAAAGGAIGGLVAGEIGTFIAKKRIGQKGLSYAAETVADIADLPELPGDIIAGQQLKTLRRSVDTGRLVLPQGVARSDVIPGNLAFGKVRTPIGNVFAFGDTPTPTMTSASIKESTPGFSTSPTTIPVPQQISFSTKAPVPTETTVTLPSPTPVPVPITSTITIPSSRTPPSTPSQIDIPVPVPGITPTSTGINIPAPVRDRPPFLPLFFGGGGRGGRKSPAKAGKGATKTIFQTIFSGMDFTPITTKAKKEQTGILLRG